MKNFRKILYIVVLFSVVGCSSTPLQDKINDSKDIFTFSLNHGYGANVTAGPFFLGLHGSGSDLGLVDGVFTFKDCEINKDKTKTSTTILFIVKYEAFDPTSDCSEREKQRSYEKKGSFFLINPGKDFRRLTYFEIQVGLILGIRLGFNAGELVDFMSGFLGFDIYDDDVEYKKIFSKDTLNDLYREKNR